MGFASMHILVPQEGEKAKAIGEDMWIALFKSWIQCDLRN